MSSILAKLLASAVMKKVAISVLIKLLKELAKRSDNTIDDELVKAVEEALQ
jgi:hypothetical protein